MAKSETLELGDNILRTLYKMAKKLAPFLYALTLPNINRFSQLFQLTESGENL